MTNQQQTAETEAFISKDAAAAALGLSGRRTADYAQRGRIERRSLFDPKSKRMVSMFKQSDVERLAEELRSGAGRPGVVAAQPAQPALLLGAGAALAEGVTPIEFKRVAEGDRRYFNPIPAAPAEPRPWLSLTEAAAVSGLPEKYLRALIRSGELTGVFVGYKNGGYRLHKENLSNYRPDLKPAKTTSKRKR